MNLRSAAVLLLLAAAPASAADAPLQGIHVGDIDRAVKPCDDFYAFANGTWRRENPIPASMSRWNRRFASGELAKDQLKVILDELSARKDWPRGSVEQMVGDHYA